MERTEIASLYRCPPADGTQLTVCGWAKNIRDSKNIGFIALSDGGCFKTLQLVLEAGKVANYDQVIHTGLYSSLRVTGTLVHTPQAKQPFELNVDTVEILGSCPAEEYPLQKKKMSMEYLRTMPTLRPRNISCTNSCSQCCTHCLKRCNGPLCRFAFFKDFPKGCLHSIWEFSKLDKSGSN